MAKSKETVVVSPESLSTAWMICSMGVMPGGYREEHGSDSTRTIRTCY